MVVGFFALGALLLILQTTVLQFLPAWLGRPDLVFVLVVFVATHLKLLPGAVVVLLLGLISDIFSGIFLGLYPVVYVLLFAALKGMSRHLLITEPIHQPPLVALSYLLATFAAFVFCSFLAMDFELQWAWRGVLLQMLILAVVAIPLSHFFQWAMQLFTRKKRSKSFSWNKTDNRFK